MSDSDAFQSRSRAASTSSNASGSASGTVTNKSQPSRGLQLLPLVVKHYKTALLLLLVWLIGYLGFSTTWILIGFFFYVVNEEYRKVKKGKRNFAEEAAVNEKSAILARIDELPAWVYFPDIERAEWLNKMIKQMWPYIGDYVRKLLKETVEPIVDSALPGSLKPFKFEHIDLGDVPPRIGGVKVYSENVQRDEVILDLEIFYAGDAEVKVAVRGMNAGVKHLTIHGIVRIVFQPLVPVVPLIGGMNVFFLNQPSIDFDLTNIANLLDTPVLSNTLRTVLENVIASFMVLPNKIPIQLASNIDINKFKFPMPQGVLRLHVIAARELIKADTGLLGKSSDPYCKIYVGAQSEKTRTIKNNINPVWNKYYEFVVDQKHGQVVELEVLDEDPGKDDELGSASINIENIASHGSMDSWLPLENVKSGMIHIRAHWFHLSKNPDDLDRISTVQDKIRPNTEEYLSTALLVVTVDSARNLPRGKKSMSEPSPYVNIGVGTRKKGIMKPKTTDPRWEETFQFMVHDPRVQELYMEVLDGSKNDKKLGYINYPIKNLMTAKDMMVNRPFQLKDSTPNAKVTLRLSLRILTSEIPPDWALDASAIDTPAEESDPTAPDSTTPDDTTQQEEAEEPLITSETMGEVQAEINDNVKHFTIGGDSDAGSTVSAGPELRHRGASLSSSVAPFGKVQLTLRYSSNFHKLVMVVHQCVNLIPCDDDNLADPYVRIYILPERSSSNKKKTRVCKNTLNPVFDETFEWSLSQSEASSKVLDVLVKNSTGILSRSQKCMGQLFIEMSRLGDITKSTTDWYDLLDPDTDRTSLASM